MQDSANNRRPPAAVMFRNPRSFHSRVEYLAGCRKKVGGCTYRLVGGEPARGIELGLVWNVLLPAAPAGLWPLRWLWAPVRLGVHITTIHGGLNAHIALGPHTRYPSGTVHLNQRSALYRVMRARPRGRVRGHRPRKLFLPPIQLGAGQ